jgi:uncharacterized protein YijF (DUF1287 family)
MRTLLFLNLFFLVACSNKTPLDNPIFKTAIKFSEEKTWLYDPNYYKIAYPNGDVPSGGACTDVIIRVLCENDMDLQHQLHNDLK